MKPLAIAAAIIAPLIGANIIGLQYKGVSIEYTDADGIDKNITVEREIDPKCLYVHITNDMIWKGNYASREVPKECKSVFVTSVGQIQPAKIHPEIETYAELEVLDFIEKMQKSSDMLLVDTRTEPWFDYRTIPGAVNIPHISISKSKVFPEDFKKSLEILGVKGKSGEYNFSEAKTIAIFCNGAWCGQSPSMIKALLKLGYPAGKIKWYRGGIHDWLASSMTSTRHQERSKRK